MNKLREVRFQPYRKGLGPRFRLITFDAVDSIAYSLTQHKEGKTTVLFAGDDFGPSPLHAWDSDESIAALMGFLTLRPGDTDAEYFEDYTDVQRDFCDQHAEALGGEVYNRFEEN